MDLDAFEKLVKSRRANRRFKSKPVADDLIKRLVDIARWAPSGYNLQPTHFFIVTRTALKQRLHAACLKQRQILEAPAIIVFTADRRVHNNHFERMVALEKENQSMPPEYERMFRRFVTQAFGQGPWGLGWLGKWLAAPLLRLGMPLPSIPAIHKRYWLAKQVMLCAMNFMLGAHAAGLVTVPMEGFDEARVRKVLGIPRHHIVPVIIPVGYPKGPKLSKTRLPLEDVIHRET